MPNSASAGDLRFRVRFDFQVEVDDPFGGTVSSWSTMDNGSIERWADIRPQRGGEQVMAQRLTGVQPVLIIVRKDNGTKMMDTSWRAVEMLNGSPVKFYALKTCEDMERDNSFLTMVAEAGAADGGDGA